MTRATLGQSSSTRRAVRTAAWLVATALVLWVAVETLGADSLARAVARADAPTVAAVGAVALAVLALRGVALGVLLDVLGHRTPVGRVVGAFAVVTVVSTLVPGGRAGGAPVNGFVVARSADTSYEDGVASVLVVSAVTNLAVGAFGILGVVALLLTAGGGGVALLAALGVGLVALAVVAAVALWRVRDSAFAVAVRAVTTALRAAGAVPRLSVPDRETVERRAERFRDALGRLRDGSPRQVALFVGLLAAAHALTVLALWLSFQAVGGSVSVGVLLAVIPAAVAAAVVPTPGGIGGVDVALVGLLAAGSGAVAPVAGAAVLVYRTATSGPALAAGGVALAGMVALGWFGDASDE